MTGLMQDSCVQRDIATLLKVRKFMLKAINKDTLGLVTNWDPSDNENWH